jgi:nicotinamide mononucleotide (NMN) deamidase PncC
MAARRDGEGDELGMLARALQERCDAVGRTVALAESCTGSWDTH